MNDQPRVSTTHRRLRTAIVAAPWRSLLAAFTIVFVLLGVTAPAHATAPVNSVVSSSPADGAVLDTPPVAIIVNFAEEIGDTTNLALTCSAEVVQLPSPEFGDDDRSLTIDLDGIVIPRGTCSIRWTTADGDGNPTGNGIITFSVTNGTESSVDPGAAPDDTATSTPITTSTPTDTSPDEPATAVPIDDFSVSGTGDGAVWLGRFLSTTAIAILFGGLVVITMAWPEGVEYLVTVRFLRVVWVIALIGTLLFTAAAAGAVTGDGFSAGLSPGTWGELAGGGWAGRAVLARLLLVVASGVVAFRPDLAIDPTTQFGALGVPALATAMVGITRTTGDLVVVTVAAGIVHAIAMAIWIGGAVLVARVVLAGPGEEDLVHAVRGFSRISMGSVVVTVVTGVVLLVQLDGGDLFGSGHGRVLLLKAIVVAVIVFLAITARQVVGQRLARAQEMGVREADRLRRAFGAEAGIGMITLALSAWLLAFTPSSIDDTPRIPYEVNQQITVEIGGQEAFDLVLRLTDDRVGRIGMEVDVTSPAEGLSNLQVVFTAPPNSLNVGQIIQPVPLTGTGVAVRLESEGLPFAVPGDWTVQVTATTPLGQAESETLTLRVFQADGTTAETVLTVPQPSLVEIPADGTATTVPAATPAPGDVTTTVAGG
ncbi:MAG: CopD family protein [Actinomycetota bacterium]